MKVRLGFVSNSSTSSFLLYGAELDQDMVTQRLAELNNTSVEEIEKKYEDEGLYEMVDALVKDTPLTYEVVAYEYPYIGLSWSAVQDNETGLQFKQRIETEVNRIMGREVECATHSEAWHD